MEKTKSKSTKKMRCHRPYLWSRTDIRDKKQIHKKAVEVSSYDDTNPPEEAYMRPRALTRGRDPYAPHLKYGIFPRRSYRAEENANLQSRSFDEHSFIRRSREIKQKAQSDEPFFLIRPLDKNSLKQLSTSQTMHIDIEPRRHNESRFPNRG